MNKITPSTQRVLIEDALKHIYLCEQEQRQPTTQSIAGVLHITLDDVANLIAKLVVRKLLRLENDALHLTSTGQEYAMHIVRAHRLWERYLADETGFTETEWHDLADCHEHTLSPAETEALSAKLGHPTHDPHGDPIPTADGEIVSHGGQPLTSMGSGESGRIVHLEDEPALVYAQLIAEGLYVGMEVHILGTSSQRIRFRADGEEHVLAPIVAANISVLPLSEEQKEETIPTDRLAHLKPGQKGKVVNISPICRGPERRRLMDLGILPGTIITAEMKSPSGDPTAYNIRGSLIALRQEQANVINITTVQEEARQ